MPDNFSNPHPRGYPQRSSDDFMMNLIVGNEHMPGVSKSPFKLISKALHIFWNQIIRPNEMHPTPAANKPDRPHYEGTCEGSNQIWQEHTKMILPGT